jgi:hypothetical protein
VKSKDKHDRRRSKQSPDTRLHLICIFY